MTANRVQTVFHLQVVQSRIANVVPLRASGCLYGIGKSFGYLLVVILEMYINGKLVESAPLSLQHIHNPAEREGYIQGAVKYLWEKWNDLVGDQDWEPQFFIRGEFPVR